MVKSVAWAWDVHVAADHHAPAELILSAAKDKHYGKEDCSDALGSGALTVKSLGLGSSFLDVPNEYFLDQEGAQLRRQCGIPEDYETICFLSVGYPADAEEQPTEKRDDVFTFVE